MAGQDLDSSLYNNWASMLSKLFVTPTQEILKVSQKFKDEGNNNNNTTKSQGGKNK